MGNARIGSWAALACGLAASMYFGARWYSSSRSDSIEDIARASVDPEVVKAAERGQAVLAPMPVVPLADVAASPQHVTAWLSERTRAESADERAVVRLAAEMMYWRFVQPDMSAYLRWRESLGTRWRSLEYMNQVWTVRKDASFFGISLAPDASQEEIFRAFWDHERSPDPHRNMKGNRLRGVLDDPRVFRVQFDVVPAPAKRWPPFGAGEEQKTLWNFEVGGSPIRWWTNPRTSEAVVKQHGQLRLGRVSFAVLDEAGRRWPVVVQCYWDPTDSQWRIEEWFWGTYEPVRAMFHYMMY
ncbi:MAG: hypothetical protein SFY95_02800 [Planctomycetota bacterium]|nr:hypothetical protein [Planctomycetota bacterium]